MSAPTPLTPQKRTKNSLLEEPPRKQKSPQKRSPQKPSVAGSFYSKQKTLYLTPLERKLLKETKSPPAKSVEEKPNPPASEGKPKGKRGRPSKKITSSKIQKPSIKGYLTAKVSTKKAATSETSQKPPILAFGSLKNKAKPKILVGAAFFASGKKPSAMYKMAVPWKAKQTEGQEKSKAQVPEKAESSEKEKEKEHKGRSPIRQAVFVRKPPQKEVPRLPDELTNTEKPKETPLNLLPSPDVVGSPRALLEKYGIMKDVRVMLRRSVSPSHSVSSLDNISTQVP